MADAQNGVLPLDPRQKDRARKEAARRAAGMVKRKGSRCGTSWRVTAKLSN